VGSLCGCRCCLLLLAGWCEGFCGVRAFQGLRGRELYVRAVQTERPIPMREFTADFKNRMRCVWRDAELAGGPQHEQQQIGHLSFLVCHPFF
jgi:hypothetical protein